MSKLPVGVVGLGFVGEAVYRGLVRTSGCTTVEMHGYDKFKKLTPNDCGSLEELLRKVPNGPIFVCVPTPMLPDGRCDLRIVREVLSELDTLVELLYEHDPPSVKIPEVVIKSTIPPGTTVQLMKEFPFLHLGFNPEFLTERNHLEDFKSQKYVILGGINLDRTIAVYVEAFMGTGTRMVLTDATTAEMVKYVANTFLAAKVSLANEYYDLCQAMDVNYGNLVEILHMDDRLGKTHWRVPGPDGQRGFSGACFPKDINALIKVMEDKGVDPLVLKAAWQTNLNVRPSRDWESLKGRAVSADPQA